MSNATVEASHLGKAFGSRQVLQDLSFAVMPGEVIGVLGKNGAGKTTLLELVLGFTPPTEGDVRVFGHTSQRMPGETKRRVGFVPQQDELLDSLSVGDQIRVIASFYPSWDASLIDRLCGEWGIDTRARIKSMSVGERQKLSILLAFGHRPDLLILDEPVASLDPVARRQFLEQLVELCADGERSVVFSSHIVSDIERLANRIWILKEGRLFWQGGLDSLKESIVRVHLRCRRELPENLNFAGLLSLRRVPGGGTAVVRDWTEATQSEVIQRIGGEAEVETLALEEIFLELHR
ncbi:MAG TPA: ABC transporter ATP-binding protein [Steroidobacteraceae bacterium]|jgi:ABC-2 type transport system ATP-binding protein